MTFFSTLLPPYAADTSGVCSALYELGGMTVVHDASGCNSTYSTFDEPRWWAQESMVYISGLTESEAVFGAEERLAESVCQAAEALRPRFVALCGSPVPLMLNTDYQGLARALSKRLGIPVFGIPTSGMHPYSWGASKALEAVAGHFARRGREQASPRGRIRLCMAGATPLDFPLEDTAADLRSWAAGEGFKTVSLLAMDATLEDAVQAGSADVCLAVSSAGAGVARLLRERWGVPCVTGAPLGVRFAGDVARAVRRAFATGQDQLPCRRWPAPQAWKGTLAIGESVLAASLACEAEALLGISAKALAPLGDSAGVLAEGDAAPCTEATVKEALAKASAVYADPLYRLVCPQETAFAPVVHRAFSGRCHAREARSLVGRPIPLPKGGFPC